VTLIKASFRAFRVFPWLTQSPRGLGSYACALRSVLFQPGDQFIKSGLAAMAF